MCRWNLKALGLGEGEMTALVQVMDLSLCSLNGLGQIPNDSQ